MASATVVASGGSLIVNGFTQGVTVEGGTLAVINGGKLQVGDTPAANDLLVASNMIISGAGSSVTVTYSIQCANTNWSGQSPALSVPIAAADDGGQSSPTTPPDSTGDTNGEASHQSGFAEPTPSIARLTAK